MKRLSPGKIMTGFDERSGRRAEPLSQRAVQARCSSVQIVAVSVGAVKGGIAVVAPSGASTGGESRSRRLEFLRY